MAPLLQPVVPGVTSFGNVLAQATQNAAMQSRNILAAASSIARQRERAGQEAQDAIVRRRMERFQREQFEQKMRVENQRLENEAVRLGFASDANKRTNAAESRNAKRFPLEQQLLRNQVDLGPLRLAEAGLGLVESGQRVATNQLNLDALPGTLEDRDKERDLRLKALESQTDLDIFNAEEVLESSKRAIEDVEEIQQILKGNDGTPQGVLNVLQNLEALQNQDDFSFDHPRVLSAYNSGIRSLNLGEENTNALIIPDPMDPAQLGPGESLTLQTSRGQRTFRSPAVPTTTSAEVRQQMNNAIAQYERQREGRDRIIEEELKTLRSQLSKAGKGTKGAIELERRINDKVDQLRESEVEFRGKVDELQRRVIQQAQGLTPNFQTDLFPGVNTASYLDSLREEGVIGSAQKKTESVNPFTFNDQGPKQSESFDKASRREGEFNIISGPIVETDANDGDSFIMDTPDGDKHFRLYFADSLETNNRRLTKSSRQADHFGISETEVPKYGLEAKILTDQWLRNEPFEVITRGERLMDSKRDHAMIYFPFAPLGERWLAERLVTRGLATITTKGSKLPDGTSAQEFRKRLLERERVAKANRFGAWANTQ